MSATLSASAVLDRTYLEVRARLLELAAIMDRIDRAPGSEGMQQDPRLGEIQKGIDILKSTGFNRAERIQLVFSDPYVPNWNRSEKSGNNGSKH